MLDLRVLGKRALVGFLATGVIVALSLLSRPAPDPSTGEGGYVHRYSPSRTTFDVLLNQADGQAYAALALDPTLADRNAFISGPDDEAFVARRPLLPALILALSFGQESLIPYAYSLVVMLGGAVLVGGGAAVLQALGEGRDDRVAYLLLALPGAFVSIQWLGPECYALGVALVGLALWVLPKRHPAAAIALFTAAALARETALLVVVVVGLVELWRGRGRFLERVVRVVPLAVPFLVTAGWAVFVRWRLGSFGTGRPIFTLPFAGVPDAVRAWEAPDYLVAFLLLALAVAAFVKGTDVQLTAQVAGHLLLLSLLGPPLTGLEGFSRIVLPLGAFAILDLAPARDRRRVPRRAPVVPPTPSPAT